MFDSINVIIISKLNKYFVFRIVTNTNKTYLKSFIVIQQFESIMSPWSVSKISYFNFSHNLYPLGIFITLSSNHSELSRFPVLQFLYISSLFINRQIGLVITPLSLVDCMKLFLPSKLFNKIVFNQKLAFVLGNLLKNLISVLSNNSLYFSAVSLLLARYLLIFSICATPIAAVTFVIR